MNKLFERIGYIITGMSAVTFVLLMTIIGMIFLSHGLYFQILSKTMEPWHATAAAWALALGWEFTVLITTCNVKFVNRRLPGILAVCSGLIVLFFIQAFDQNQPILDLVMRWFIGIIVATVNYVYSELFYEKWKENVEEINTKGQLIKTEQLLNENIQELSLAKDKLQLTHEQIQSLTKHIAELEAYKQQEIEKVTCPKCHSIFGSVFKLSNHKARCGRDNVKEIKLVHSQKVISN